MIIRQFLLISMLLLHVHSIFCSDLPILPESLENKNDTMAVFQSIETRLNYVSFIQNSAEERFVVKQTKNGSPLAQLDHIKEVFATHIAQSIGIFTNHVFLLPKGLDIAGKPDKERLATLHTWVPGCSTIKMFSPPFIRQGTRMTLSSYDKIGLTRKMIRNMSKHPDLSKIVAFDTYLGNYDRSLLNLFYDKKIDRFYMIDMERALSVNLCYAACYHMEIISKEKTIAFSPAEINALTSFCQTLHALVEKYPPQEQNNLFDYYLSQSELERENQLDTEAINHKIEWYKALIADTYTSAKKLITLINTLITPA